MNQNKFKTTAFRLSTIRKSHLKGKNKQQTKLFTAYQNI